jgi:periplasmic divalent cation tolerance protein
MTPRLVLVTASSLDEARRIADALLLPHLAACVNIVPGVESHYWWQGKREQGSEVLLMVKTSAEQFEAVSAAVRAHHSYECPEIVALDPREMAPAYRAWWAREMES